MPLALTAFKPGSERLYVFSKTAMLQSPITWSRARDLSWVSKSLSVSPDENVNDGPASLYALNITFYVVGKGNPTIVFSSGPSMKLAR
jgi:hypothetical protein